MNFDARNDAIATFRRKVCENVVGSDGLPLLPLQSQADWQLATEGWTLLKQAPAIGDHYARILVPDAVLAPYSMVVGTRIVNDIPCSEILRKIELRTGGAAHICADLAAFKAGKSFWTALWMTGFAAIPKVKVQMVALQYANAEMEFNYLAEFLLSAAPRGMGMPYKTYHNDKRNGKMRIVLRGGTEFEVMSWDNKESLKGKKVIAYVYCLPLSAPVWMGDYSFKPLGDVKVGDEVIGMSRQPWIASRGGGRINQKHTRRCLVRTTVTAVHRKLDRVYRLRFASGRIARCTDDHRWLSGRTIGVDRYITPKVGAQFVHVVDEPTAPPPNTEWLRGFLAGIYDGEGSRTFIAQDRERNSATHKRIADALRSLGFETIERNRGVRWNGGQAAALKFLTWTQSPRYRERWVDEALLVSRFGTPDEIVEIVDEGIQEVGCITTETGNFVAYGFLTKNCEAYQLPDFSVYTTLAQNLRELRGFALFPTTPDRPWVGVFHDYGHGQDPDWHCTCCVDANENPFTYDQKARDRDDPTKGGIMTRERFAISWEGKLGRFIGRVYDFSRGDHDRYFWPDSHPIVWSDSLLDALEASAEAHHAG